MVMQNRLNITMTIKISLYYVRNIDDNEELDLFHCVYVDNKLTCSEQDFVGEYQVSAYFSINEENFRFVFAGEDPDDCMVYIMNEETDDERLSEREVSELFIFEKKEISEEDYRRYHNHFDNGDLAPLQLQYELYWDDDIEYENQVESDVESGEC